MAVKVVSQHPHGAGGVLQLPHEFREVGVSRVIGVAAYHALDGDRVPWAESAVSRRLFTSDLMSGSTSRVKPSNLVSVLSRDFKRVPELRPGSRPVEILQHAPHALQDLRQITGGSGGEFELLTNLLDARRRRIRCHVERGRASAPVRKLAEATCARMPRDTNVFNQPPTVSRESAPAVFGMPSIFTRSGSHRKRHPRHERVVWLVVSQVRLLHLANLVAVQLDGDTRLDARAGCPGNPPHRRSAAREAPAVRFACYRTTESRRWADWASSREPRWRSRMRCRPRGVVARSWP